MRHATLRCALAMMTALISGAAGAQGVYPDHKVRMIVPFAAGGPTDVIGRMVAERLSDAWGQQIYVENLPGAGGNLGVETAKRADPDGYTILAVSTGFIINPSMYSKIGYDPIKDFAPISLVAASPNVVTVHPSVAANTLKELIDLIKASPGKFSFAQPATGSTPHLAGELFKQTYDLDLVTVPFNGAPLAVNSTLGNHTPIAFTALPPAMGNIKDGSLKGVAILAKQRIAALPDLPTNIEEGVPGLESDTLTEIVAPAGTPQAIVDKWHDAIVKMIADPDVKKKLDTLGFVAVANTPARAGYTLYFISYFLSVVVLLLILRLGVAARFRDIAEAVSEKRWIQCLIFVPLLILLTDLLELPVRVYWHALSLRYQQSIQHWGSWIVDWAKEEALSVGLAVLLVLVLTVAMRKSPGRWWFYFWLAALPILLFFFFISPWFIDPLFNHFEPLAKEHPQMVESIETLTLRAGVPIPRDRMFLMKASEKTNQINAYVTGIGASKRVVVWDTTIQKTSADEALFILGHELGHYVLGHVAIAFLFFAVSLLLALYVMFRALHWSLHRWGREWKINGPEDWAAIAVLLLWLEILAFISSPIANGFSRMQEHAADVYGLEVIHGLVPNSEEVAAHGFQVMGERDLSDPNPPAFITFWLYSHPPLAERLVFAHSYDPWSKGESPKYVK